MPELSPEDFAKDLLKAVRKVPGQAVKVVRANSNDVKKQGRRNVRMTAPVHHAHAFRDINYDVTSEGVEVVGEIGYDTGPGMAGNLGNLLEFGGQGDHSPPHLDLARALDGQTALFEKDAGDMGVALLSGAIEAAVRRSAEAAE
jgi:hypothetical protein